MNRAVLLIGIRSAIVSVTYGMHSPIVPVFARDQLAADYSQVGILGTVNYLPYLFAPFSVGILLDMLNKSYVLLSGILLNTFSIFLLSIVQSILEIMLYRTLPESLMLCSGLLVRFYYLSIKQQKGESEIFVYSLQPGF